MVLGTTWPDDCLWLTWREYFPIVACITHPKRNTFGKRTLRFESKPKISNASRLYVYRCANILERYFQTKMKEIGLWDKWCLETVLDVQQSTLISDEPIETLIIEDGTFAMADHSLNWCVWMNGCGRIKLQRKLSELCKLLKNWNYNRNYVLDIFVFVRSYVRLSLELNVVKITQRICLINIEMHLYFADGNVDIKNQINSLFSSQHWTIVFQPIKCKLFLDLKC